MVGKVVSKGWRQISAKRGLKTLENAPMASGTSLHPYAAPWTRYRGTFRSRRSSARASTTMRKINGRKKSG